MPSSVTTPRTIDNDEDYFTSAFSEINDYVDFQGNDSKSQQDPRSPRVTEGLNSPSLNLARSNSPNMWNSFTTNSPGISGYQPLNLSYLESEKQNYSLRNSSGPAGLLGNPSPPNSSENSPQKFAQPVEISPLDSLLAGFPTENTRTAHGQVTPPDDPMQSPYMAPLSAPSFPYNNNMATFEPSPINSPRSSLSMSPRTHHSAVRERMETQNTESQSAETNEPLKRRSSSTTQGGSRKRRTSSSNEEPPEVQEAKRKRFLERNRVAASKCRQKKKQWMQELESEARAAQNSSKILKNSVAVLKEELIRLKNELLKHDSCDCSPIRQYLSHSAAKIAENTSSLHLNDRRLSAVSELSSVGDALRMDGADDFDMMAGSPEAVE